MTMNTGSSKFNHIISRCDRVSDRPPVRYRVMAKTDMSGPLKKVTFGKKHPEKRNKTILLVGETGAGKSTLINALLNYTMGVKWEDEVWFEIVEDEKRGQSESQTSDVIVYEIFGFEGKTLPYSLTIIDTPGYGSTKGTEHDVIINQRLFDLFRSQDGVHEIDAVGLAVKATECRVSDRLLYIFSSIMSLFGNDIAKHIVLLITYSNGRRPENVFQALKAANIECAQNENNEPVHFLFDNYQHEVRNQPGYPDVPDTTSACGIAKLTDFLKNTVPQKLEKTVEVIKEHIRLTACIQNLQDRIELIELKRREIKEIQQAVKKHEQEMKLNAEFEIEVNEPYKHKESISTGMWGLFFYEAAVCCPLCEETCHYPGCTVAWKPAHCEVMKGGRCTVCSRKCLASAHVKEKWRYVNKIKKVKKTLTGVKEKYDKNKAASLKASAILDDLQKEIDNLEADKEKWIDMVVQHVETLSEIALKVDSVSTYVHLDYLTKKMKENGDTEKFQKLKEKICQVNEAVRSGVKYAYDGMCKIFAKNKENKEGTNV
ncbi:uncharacterized protein LOC120727979 isoform X1 [Simochromis diagramma]|uniref:uncharacterized protein LOC120727979 isoform X1 n=2 Tax=Simochromis diagramma TaxID=43689 RepID=UPI001A7EB171|nr:uncharacterized protein LOC120727979 isoform X1 [Simochromis diagramma]XP_039878534.1 uncharacterized protein LOC120727979 isoform X1 [Simochromis diagramma]